MTDRELMQQWLQPGAIVPVDANTTRILITAIREVLAQPEQEPVAYLDEGLGAFYFAKQYKKNVGFTPLYTTPPQRKPWVGLTDEEISWGFCHVEYETFNDWEKDPEGWCIANARYLEAILKEKNK